MCWTGSIACCGRARKAPFEAWPALAPTLMPILKTEVGGKFMPWTLAPTRRPLLKAARNSASILATKVWIQKPQKYHARSLGLLRAKYVGAADKAALDAILESAGCLKGLRT